MKDLQERKRSAGAHEARIARLVNGKCTPASGALGMPGDVRTSWLLISCKETEQRTLKLNLSDIEQIDAYATVEGLTPAMAFNLQSARPGVENDWVLLPLRVVLSLITQKVKQGDERET